MGTPIKTAEAIKEGLTAQHIATNLANYEAARTSFFVFSVDLRDPNDPERIPNGNLLKTNYTGSVEDAKIADMFDRSIAEEILKLNVTKCDVPHYEVAVNEYRRGNDIVKWAGTPTFNGGSLTVDDIVGLDTKSLLMSWLRLAYDPHTFKGGRMKDYKKTCTLTEYTQDYEEIRSWTLYGCFVTKITEDSFDRENDGKRQLTVEFSYDRAVMKLPEEE